MSRDDTQHGSRCIALVQEHVRTHGLDLISEPPYGANVSEDGPLVGLRYDDVDSDLALPIVQGCRGIILDRSANWDVVSPGMPKFFNAREPQAARIDWGEAVAYRKMDGSACVLYHHNGSWHVHTLGSLRAQCEVQIGATAPPEVARTWDGRTFAELFWEAVRRVYGASRRGFGRRLRPGRAYVFELCTPANRIVVPYDGWRLPLIAVRSMDADVWWPELPVEEVAASDGPMGWADTPPVLRPRDLEQAERCVLRMPGYEEGLVVRDARFNRVKIKSERYVRAHRCRGSGILQRRHGITEMVVNGIYDDFIGVFPGIADEVERVRARISETARRTERIFDACRDGADTRKQFALAVEREAPDVLHGPLFAMLDDDALGARGAIRSMRPSRIERAADALGVTNYTRDKPESTAH